MPGFAIGIPAKECKTGSKLRLIKGSVCHGCYALKGCYVFPVVQAAQYKRLGAITHPLWTAALAHLINSKKSKEFRWHDSGDVQNLDHLIKIFAVCKLTPSVKHWMPTREAWVKPYLKNCPDNLAVRFSMPMVNAVIVEHAGIKILKTFHMENIKPEDLNSHNSNNFVNYK
jgi:hypothetical protein